MVTMLILRRKKMIMNDINRVMEDYEPDETIWREYDDTVLWLKRAMNKLEDADRIIFMLYCEYGSLRKVGKKLGVSHSIIYKNIKRIKEQMYDYIRTYCDNDDSGLCDRFKRVLSNGEETDMEVAD